MALITCPECGAQVSSAAASCIKCGCPLTKTKICGECKATIAENASVCPHCGHPQNLVRVRLVDDLHTRKYLSAAQIRGVPVNDKWKIVTGGSFKSIVLAEGKGFNTISFTLEEPVLARISGVVLHVGGSCTIHPGNSYKVYCTGYHFGGGGATWVFEEDT